MVSLFAMNERLDCAIFTSIYSSYLFLAFPFGETTTKIGKILRQARFTIFTFKNDNAYIHC